MRYIGSFIAFILFCTVNLNAAVINVFSDTNNIYYSSVDNITNSFVLNNGNSDEVSNDMTLIFERTILGSSYFHGLSYSSDIKYITGANGGKAVFFPNIRSYVKIDHYLDSSDDVSMSSFTFEFYLNPYRVRMNSKVLSKMAIYNDNGVTKYAGIRANIINGRLVWQFNNLFSYNGQYTNVTLSGGEYLKENEWRHHSVSFDASTGKLVKYIDGLEEEVIYLTSTGDRNGSPYVAEFENIKLDPLYLGQGFIGGLDSFYFTPDYKHDFNLYRYSSNGEIISRVIDFEDKNTFIDSINYTGSFTNGCYIDLYYRTSDYYFAPDDNNIAWQYLDNNTNAITSNVRYLQIRAVLNSNADRNITPILNNVDILYHKGRLPQTPVNLTATAVNNNSVMLKWDSVHEDVAGYKIYYGTKPGVYNDAEYTPIRIGNQTEYYIEGLNTNEVYYFTITAIGGEGGNIESGFSKEVYVRPVH
ncbi:fibronectin type III domain-containing protein [Brachyspira sp. G79]|uniref:fibronectin type III domain-containing protein n=1 Tax=Brachyspira sp. G79 TaxID=1358104 RepID=UPI000BBC761D|nr:fibronectin type III domain-containing protein [Brachyspira sp. G79]PCG19645.1 fibronectin [Brachyspira sp. G79]